MIGSAINTAVSGLLSSSSRLAGSANNIANLSSTLTNRDGKLTTEAYQPVRVDQISVDGGGVRSVVRPVDPATTPRFDPDNAAADANGITQFPNISLEQEVVNQITATYDFKANLKVIKAADENTKSLLDIFA